MIESTRMLLDWLGRAHGVFPAVEAAAAMREAMDRALASPATRTRDIAGTADLEGMTQGILSALGAETGKKPHARSEEHTSELQSLMRISYAVFCLKTKKQKETQKH